MIPDEAAPDTSKRGPNYERNLRPPTSTRGTFALGREALERADRLARIASNHKEGGVSRSAVLRGLLRFGEAAALRSGDPSVAAVLANSKLPDSGKLPLPAAEPDAAAAELWRELLKEILES
ncbi:MAG: hypothetical protein H7Y36_09870 [Armatimonadetes bacterium]|nr:hypothetical protein [Akkermansiaceae bacterium]